MKGYHFWSQQRRRVFISTRAIFDERVFPYCFRGKEDGPAPIPVEEENPQAMDDSSQEDDHRPRDLELRHDILVQQPLGLGFPNQPIPPDRGQQSGNNSPWRTPSETRRPPSFKQESQPISLLFYDTPPGDPPSSPSQQPSSYHPSPMKPARKRRAQVEERATPPKTVYKPGSGYATSEEEEQSEEGLFT